MNVAQVAVWLLTTPEVYGSHPAIAKNPIWKNSNRNVFLNRAFPASFSFIFRLFQQTNVKKSI